MAILELFILCIFFVITPFFANQIKGILERSSKNNTSDIDVELITNYIIGAILIIIIISAIPTIFFVIGIVKVS